MSRTTFTAALFASLTLLGTAGVASAQRITVTGPRVGVGGPRVVVRPPAGPRVVVRPPAPPRVVVTPPPRVVVRPPVPPRVVVTPPPRVVHVTPPPVYVNPAPTYVAAPAVYPMSEPDFAGLLGAIANEGFDSNRLTVLSSAAAHNYFVASQVIRVLDQFSFSSTKLQALEVMQPRLLGHQEDHLIVAAFTFSSDKAAAQQILSR